MRSGNHVVGTVLASLLAVACAKGGTGTVSDASPTALIDSSDVAPPVDSCGMQCDSDHDGVYDGTDKCPSTPAMAPVNHAGCSDGQLMPKLEPTFPSYGLTWTPTGSIGRAGGLTWTYTGMQRGDLFHIWWLVCDDPTTSCGLSLDGPIDQTFEKWTFVAASSDLPNGKLVFINTTHITLADTTTTALSGRLTVTIVDASAIPIPFATVSSLGIVARAAPAGAEIKGTGFKVTAIAEVQDPMTLAYTPTLDYYDAAPTADPGNDAGGPATVSFDGAFYDK